MAALDPKPPFGLSDKQRFKLDKRPVAVIGRARRVEAEINFDRRYLVPCCRAWKVALGRMAHAQARPRHGDIRLVIACLVKHRLEPR